MIFNLSIFLNASFSAFPIAEAKTAHTSASIGAFIPVAIAITVGMIELPPPKAALCSAVKFVLKNSSASVPKNKIVFSSEP